MRKSVMLLAVVIVLTVTVTGCGQRERSAPEAQAEVQREAIRKTSPEEIVAEVVRIIQTDDWSGIVQYMELSVRERLEFEAQSAKRSTERLRELERTTGQKLDMPSPYASITHELKWRQLHSYTNPGMTLEAEVTKQGIMHQGDAGDAYIACLSVRYIPGERDIKAGLEPFSAHGAIALVKENGKWVIVRQGTTISGTDGDLHITNEFCGRS